MSESDRKIFKTHVVLHAPRPELRLSPEYNPYVERAQNLLNRIERGIGYKLKNGHLYGPNNQLIARHVKWDKESRTYRLKVILTTQRIIFRLVQI